MRTGRENAVDGTGGASLGLHLVNGQHLACEGVTAEGVSGRRAGLCPVAVLSRGESRGWFGNVLSPKRFFFSAALQASTDSPIGEEGVIG